MTKNKNEQKPFYWRWWFMLLVAIALTPIFYPLFDKILFGENYNNDMPRVVAESNDDVSYENTAQRKTLKEGTHSVGTDIRSGRYKISCQSGSGNIYISNNGTIFVNEILNSKREDFGVTSIEVDLFPGNQIEISGIDKVKFEPSPFRARKSLPTGIHLVGRDIAVGKYTATTRSESGNFTVYDTNGELIYNEILSSSNDGFGTKSLSVTLQNGYIIQISGLEKVSFK